MAESIKLGTTSTDPETRSLKLPPQSAESESAVLGALLIAPDTWQHVAEKIQADDFYRKDHELIFSVIAKLESEGKPYDVITVAEWLETYQKLDEAGGISYLADLADNVASTVNVLAYADIIRKRSILRRLVRASTEISESVFNPAGRSCEEILDSAEKAIFEIAERETRRRNTYLPISDLLTSALDRIDELFQKKNPITGIATGFDKFDEQTAGLQRSDLIIVAGRPSMGKTSFAINIAEHAAIKEQLSVAIFSMEMPGEQLAMRMMSSLGRIDQHKVRTGRLEDNDWPRLTSVVELLNNAKMFIDDTPALTPVELRSRCRAISRKHGLDLVIVDYLQLMQVPGTVENRATEISEISRSLKAMAKELKVPVIALSQLNRSLEQRPDKRPVMSDLRESGAIEQDADLIVFIYRDEVYNKESSDKGMAEIIIGKQRNGPIGFSKLTFLGQLARFENYIEDRPYMLGHHE